MRSRGCGFRLVSREANVDYIVGFRLLRICSVHWRMAGHKKGIFLPRCDYRRCNRTGRCCCPIGGGIIRRAATEVAVSNRRVLIKRGFFSRRSIEVLLPKVESIGVDEPLFGRMLGYGTVIVRGTVGTFEMFTKSPTQTNCDDKEQIGARESH